MYCTCRFQFVLSVYSLLFMLTIIQVYRRNYRDIVRIKLDRYIRVE